MDVNDLAIERIRERFSGVRCQLFIQQLGPLWHAVCLPMDVSGSRYTATIYLGETRCEAAQAAEAAWFERGER